MKVAKEYKLAPIFLNHLLELPPPDLNMKKALNAFENASNGGFVSILYRWPEPWVTIGANQSEKECIGSECTRWLKRPTGGGAVLHGHDITLTLAIPNSYFSYTERYSPISMYKRALVPILSALEQSGVEAMLGEKLYCKSGAIPWRNLPASCFATTSRNDIVLKSNQQKIGGCAMKVGMSAVLLQASFPYISPMVEPTRWIKSCPELFIHEWDWTHFAEDLEVEIKKSILSGPQHRPF